MPRPEALWTIVAALSMVVAPMAARAEEGPPPEPPPEAAAEEAPAEEEAPAVEEAPAADAASDEARRHFMQAVALFAEGDNEAALAEFRASYRARPLPAVLYNIGAVERRLHRYADAVATFRRYLDESDAAGEPPERIEEVRRLMAELEALLAEVSIEVSHEGADVLVEGAAMGTTPLDAPLQLQAGEHSIEVNLEGFETHREAIEVAGGERRRIIVELRAVRQRQWYEQWWVWTVVGVVVVGAAVAVAVPLSLPPEEADFGPIRLEGAAP